jgi:hypothetical protein
MRALALALLCASSLGCAVLGIQVPCEADADCPSGGMCTSDGLCGDAGAGEGEGEGEGERVDEGECEGLREENPSWPDGARVVVAGLSAPVAGCFPSLERALRDDRMDGMHVYLPAGRDYAVENGPILIDVLDVTIEGESREATVVRGDTALLDVPRGATILNVTLEVPDGDSAIVGTGPNPDDAPTPTLDLTDISFTAGSGGAVSLDDIALQATGVLVEDNLGIELWQYGDPNVANYFESSTFNNASLRLQGDNTTAIDGCAFFVSDTAWLELGAAMVHVSSETHVEPVAPGAACTAGIRIVAGSATFRYTHFGALTCPAIHLVEPAEAEGPIVRVDLGSALDPGVEPQDGPHGENTFASAPAIVVDKAFDTFTLDATGNTWLADDPVLCGHSIRASRGLSVQFGDDVEDACVVRCSTAVPYDISDTAHVVNTLHASDGARCHEEIQYALEVASSDMPNIVWVGAGVYSIVSPLTLSGEDARLLGPHADAVTLSGTWPLISSTAEGPEISGVTLAGTGTLGASAIDIEAVSGDPLVLRRSRLAEGVALRLVTAVTLDRCEVEAGGEVDIGGSAHLTMTGSHVRGGAVTLRDQATATLGGPEAELANVLYADADRSALHIETAVSALVEVTNTRFDDGSEVDGLAKCTAQAVFVTSGVLTVRQSAFTGALGTSAQDCAGIRIADNAGAATVNLGQTSSVGENTFAAPLAVAIDGYGGGEPATVSAIGNSWLGDPCDQVTVNAALPDQVTLQHSDNGTDNCTVQ